jgi:hypothetical protein
MSIKTILVISMIIVAVNADIVFLNDDATKACPKYTCKTANTAATQTCVLGKGKLTESRTVDVSACTKDETCPVATALDSLVADTDVDVKCAASTVTPAATHFAYPGEACVADKSQCKAIQYHDSTDTAVPNADGTCTNNVCVGSLEGKKCDTLDACDLKYFCNGRSVDATGVVTPGTCKALLKQDAEGCTRSRECEAGLLCLTLAKDATTNVNKCSALSVVETGTVVTVVAAEDAGLKALACKSGVINPANNKCSEYKYDTDAANIVNGRVVCTPGSTCKYNYIAGTEKTADTKTCSCAFDAAGSGYCPYSSHDTGVADRFKAVQNIIIENYSRTAVHPENRSPTTNSDASKNSACLQVYSDVRYTGTVDCFNTILGADVCTALTSGNFINYSIIAILAVLAMFF